MAVVSGQVSELSVKEGIIDVVDTPITTFIIPSIRRPTLNRAIKSVGEHPYAVGYDDDKEGEATIRNRLIEQVDTPWVSMLDDDDTVTPDYVDKLRLEIAGNPDADCIIFREYFLHGVVLPAWPEVAFGNIPISFSVKRHIAIEHPFEDEPHEDFYFVQRLAEAGYKIHFSKYLTYRMRH